MRTKHLFYTAAMAALFAACVNDDFETISKGQNAANDGRPVVSDVKLVFGDPEAETRLVFDQNRGYGWEANDTIGALLMDNVNAHEGTWLEKYELISDIHTSYPFTYDRTNRAWGCNTKMLEGNYFFAYPWEDYDGKRRVAHSLTNQQQNGVTEAQKYVSYAENQFFIGYAQIKAGTSDKDVLNGNTVTMVPVLGAIQLQISNTGTKPYHINKVVLKGEHLSSTMTFDPTNAAYGPTTDTQKWNLSGTNTFNYANYTGNESDVATTGGYDYVYTIKENDEYERNEALRRVVQAEGQDEFAQIIINGTEQERLLAPQNGNTAYVLIMANADANVEELMMDIYTDEGMVQNVDLTVVNEAGSNGAPLYQVITSTTVEEIGPSVSNTIRVQIDDNSFVTPNTMSVYNTADLAQFIQWNAQETGRRAVTATLVKPDIELTKEMVGILTRKDNNVKLTIDGNEVLTLAKDVPANILNLGENLTLSCDIKVLGEVNVDKDSELTTMVIAEGAELNINEDNDADFDVTNKGIVNIAQNVEVNGSITNENELNIGAGADINASVTNEPTGVIAANGYLSYVTNEVNANDAEEYGVINMGKGAIIANGNNYGEIRSAEDAQVSLTGNYGEVIYVDGAAISAPGTVAYECETESIDKTLYETLTDNGVNKLTLTKSITTIKVADVKFTEIATEGGSLTVDDNLTLTVGDLNIEKSAVLKGVIAATDVVVKKGATLTNNGTINVDKTGSFNNYGTVANNGTVDIPYAVWHAGKFNEGKWNYEDADVEYTDPDALSEPQKAMNEVVKVWGDMWTTYMKDQGKYTRYYAGDPYDYSKFVATVLVGDTKWKPEEEKLREYFEDENFLTTDEVVEPSEFKVAVDTYLKAQKDAAEAEIFDKTTGEYILTDTWNKYADFYNNEGEAKDAMSANMNQWANIEAYFGSKAELAAYVWYAQDAVWSKFTVKFPYAYIWKTSTVDQAVDMWKQATDQGLATNGYRDADSTGKGLVLWVSEVLGQSSTNNPAIKTYQDDLIELGIDIRNANEKLGGFDHNQIKACADNN